MSSKKSSSDKSSLVPSESTILKWLPLVAAGGALGVSFYMLKEVQKLKKDNAKNTNSTSLPKEYIQQMDAMDEQIRKVSGFLSKQFPPPKKNNTPPLKKVPSKEDEEEYEEVEVEEVEVEVTDDETEDEGETEDVKDEISIK